ncbi:glycosyltransferase [Methylobacterium sp. C25]|uniref:glycosyltransferase n=1 Tax=Methylobacterium sp. C25 TaxID=2721622 RepID=UPI001F19544C|nr:glycosyltransferase [Methylobacterium sp. C25]MCE4226627.1 glycosyltransferase [Methylobacterium sp. C25]
MAHRNEPAVVCVPARDEVERLPRLIRSLAAQECYSEADRLRVVVVANNCSDGTVQAVETMIAGNETASLEVRLIETTFASQAAHVGTARRLALNTGAEWLDADGCEDGVLLTTDADAWLPLTWVAANLRALAAAEIVGGRLVIAYEREPDPAVARLNDRIERYWQAVRALEEQLDPPAHDPAPRHGDHTGASLALRADLYRGVGGLPLLDRGEDNALVARVQEQGGRLRHCPDVFVRVSDRAEGRAKGGMAPEMARRRLAASCEDAYLLPATEHWHGLVLRRAALRRYWPAAATAPGWSEVARRFELGDEDHAAISPGSCANAIAFVERTSRRLEARTAEPPLQDLDAALASFDRMLGEGAP